MSSMGEYAHDVDLIIPKQHKMQQGRNQPSKKLFTYNKRLVRLFLPWSYSEMTTSRSDSLVSSWTCSGDAPAA